MLAVSLRANAIWSSLRSRLRPVRPESVPGATLPNRNALNSRHRGIFGSEKICKGNAAKPFSGQGLLCAINRNKTMRGPDPAFMHTCPCMNERSIQRIFEQQQYLASAAIEGSLAQEFNRAGEGFWPVATFTKQWQGFIALDGWPQGFDFATLASFKYFFAHGRNAFWQQREIAQRSAIERSLAVARSRFFHAPIMPPDARRCNRRETGIGSGFNGGPPA